MKSQVVWIKFQRLLVSSSRHLSAAATASNDQATHKNENATRLSRALAASGLIGVILGLPTLNTTTTTTTTTSMEKANDSTNNSTNVTTGTPSTTTNQEATTEYPVCGQWCAAAAAPPTKCMIDSSIIPCRGEWCTTTCQQWDLFVLGPDDKRRPVSCTMYAAGLGYPRGAEFCQESCLIPEIRKERYPAPTGFGIMCRPNTCSPAATPLALPENGVFAGKALGELQCPCNWFGSECKDDWIPIQRITKGKTYGSLQFVTLHLQDAKQWRTVVENYRPGGVIRITHVDESNGVPQEMACTLLPSSVNNTPADCCSLEILTSPPDPLLRPEPRQVADRIRALQTGPVHNLYVNPSISGFVNGNYDYLMDYLHQNTTHHRITRVVIVSTGAGLGGALSAVDAIIKENNETSSTNNIQDDDEKKPKKPRIEISLYYGLRHLEHLPFREKLEHLAGSGAIQLTLVISGGGGDTKNVADASLGLQAAVERGNASRMLTPVSEMTAFMPPNNNPSFRPYIQHVVGLDFSSENGLLKKNGATLENTVFVTIGRIEPLRDLPGILKAVTGKSNKRVSEHVFTNI